MRHAFKSTSFLMLNSNWLVAQFQLVYRKEMMLLFISGAETTALASIV